MNARRTAGPWAWPLAVLGFGGRRAAGDDPAGLLGTPASVAIEPADATLLGRRATRQLIVTATDADGSVRDLTRALEWVSLDPEVAVVSPKGRVVPQGQRHGDDRGPAGERRGQGDGQGRGDGPARAGELPPRRDPRLQPGRLQHGGLPRHADRQGGVPAQPPRLPARPGLRRPSAARPAAGGSTRSPPTTSLILRKPLGEVPHEGGLRLAREHQDLRVPPRLDRRGGQGRPRRPRRRPARDPARRPAS